MIIVRGFGIKQLTCMLVLLLEGGKIYFPLYL